MGAPKQKWTADEEAALKAGVHKHGAGKWQTILKDPDFSDVLHSRSNVDLKDKWRNINVTASGLGSREKARLALKRNPQTPTRNDNPGALNGLVEGEEKTAEPKSHSVSSFSDKLHVAESKRNFTRLESVILEALMALKEPKGSEKIAIATYIEERYWEPPNFRKLLSSKLKSMTSDGKLLRGNHRYRIVPILSSSASRLSSSMLAKNGIRILTRPEVDAKLERMRSMSAHEAAAAAARAVAEAEAAIAEAEKAARKAEAAEAEAEAAQIFAEAATSACQKLGVY